MTDTRGPMLDPTRDDVDVLVGQYAAGTPELRDTRIGEMFADLTARPWPTELISVSALAEIDGGTVLTYTQWTRDGADPQFAAELTHAEPVEYRLYRSRTRPDPPAPGCVVVVSVEFDGPDEQRSRRWVDTVITALEAEKEPHPGGISAHFHLSTDHTRMLNYAEWTDADAHRDALARSGRGVVGTAPEWQAVLEFPGVKSSGFKRYRLVRTATAASITGTTA